MNEIIYQGKPLPIHFGLKALSNYTQMQATSFEDTVTTTNPVASIETIVSLTVSGLNEGSRKQGSDKRYTQDDVWDMIDEEPELISKITEVFMAAVTPLTAKLGALSPKGMPTVKPKRKP